MEGRTFRPLNDTISDVKDNINLQLQGASMPIPIWVGNPGMAKTQHAKLLAENMGLELIYISCSKPAEYFSGLPLTNVITLDKINSGDTYCTWTKPEIIHVANKTAKESKKQVLILFDDMQLLTGDIKQSYFFELVLERSLHSYKLDKNVAFMGTMNHTAEDGFENFYPAIVNRCQWFFVNLPFEYWYEQVGYQLDKYVAGFLKTNREYVTEMECVDGPFATNRVWSQLSDLIRSKVKNEGEKGLENKAYNIAMTMVSPSAANAFRKSIIIQKEFDFESMVKSGEYKCNKNDTVAQYLFSNVTRYLAEEKHFKQFEKFIKDCAKEDTYESLVVSTMLELRMLNQSMSVVDKQKLTEKEQKTVDKRRTRFQTLIDNLIDDINIIKIMKNPLF
jgi:hypothetical protein